VLNYSQPDHFQCILAELGETRQLKYSKFACYFTSTCCVHRVGLFASTCLLWKLRLFCVQDSGRMPLLQAPVWF